MAIQVRRRHAERGHIVPVGLCEARGDLADRHAGGLCRSIDLVVDIGDVAGVHNAAVSPSQQIGQGAEHHRRAGVADVDVVVDRRAADIHRHPVGVERLEGFQRAAEAIEQTHIHRRQAT